MFSIRLRTGEFPITGVPWVQHNRGVVRLAKTGGWNRGAGVAQLPYLFVFFDLAVADVDDAVGAGGDVGFMRYQHDGVALLP